MDQHTLNPGRKRHAYGTFQAALLAVFSAMAFQACGACGEISLGGDTFLDGYEPAEPDQDPVQDEALPPITTWARTYGTGHEEGAFSVEQTSDGGYIVAGDTDMSGDEAMDWWVIKLDREGLVQWQKLYGGPRDDMIASIITTTDGGYALSGYTRSYGSGEYDFLVLKLDAGGNITWQKAYGGEGPEANTLGIRQTMDGGYVLAGLSGSFDHLDEGPIWVLKLDGTGQVQWQKIYIFEQFHQSGDLAITAEGDIFLALDGTSSDVSQYVLARLDPDGILLWSREFTAGIGVPQGPASIQTAANGDLVFAGTWPWGSGFTGCWVMRLDPDGQILWSTTYARDSWDHYHAMAIDITMRGHVIVAGFGPFGGGGDSFWLLDLFGSGSILLQKSYGAMLFDRQGGMPRAVHPTSDGGFIMAGKTDDYGAGNMDFWVLKTDVVGNIFGDCPENIGVDTEALITEDMPTVSDVPLTVLDTDCIVTDATIRPKDTDAISRFQCGG